MGGQGAAVRKGPAEGLAIELTRARDVADSELDIVDTAIVAWVNHAERLEWEASFASDSMHVRLVPTADGVR